MWKRATGGLNDSQFEMIFTFCVDRCMNGNPWPPELSDVIVMLSDKLVDQNAFGIPFDDMLRDFQKYQANRNNYRSAEMYPFRHPVQYWIFTELRTKVYDLRLTEPEVEKRLAKMIRQWAERVAKGEQIPRPTLRVEDKTRPPLAWMEMLERAKQRSA
ncbi:replication protein P [Morganella psychrotolerans]|uniref:Replication protein n=1 Tax=Morganella psychrotolerans TaxID=368603 RepID=A0A1B8H6Y1_9GAMM|nr:replication protein P [Morganella psychrotolerans]OBU04820.1 replication protein [Morganella psychrotolerans]